MRSKLAYADEIDELPADVHYLLVRPEREQEVLESNRWAPRQPRGSCGARIIGRNRSSCSRLSKSLALTLLRI